MLVEIRDAAMQDEAAWRRLWDEYLRFYDVALPDTTTNLTWSRILDPGSPLRARVAFGDGLLGFALHHQHMSTWTESMDCYLEDLFVAETARGRGVGRALIDDLVGLATARGDGRLYWMTDKDNAQARSLYDRFTPTDGHLRYRLTLR